LLLRNGIDLVDISRFKAVVDRHGDHLLKRLFTPQELNDCGENIQSLSARFAAKEAVSKALGTGLGRIRPLEIEIIRQPTGEPALVLYGKAKERAGELGLSIWSVSLSHTDCCAIASVIALEFKTLKND
jgi:holo-[acyl-carrier protein] synthase